MKLKLMSAKKNSFNEIQQIIQMNIECELSFEGN